MPNRSNITTAVEKEKAQVLSFLVERARYN